MRTLVFFVLYLLCPPLTAQTSVENAFRDTHLGQRSLQIFETDFTLLSRVDDKIDTPESIEDLLEVSGVKSASIDDQSFAYAKLLAAKASSNEPMKNAFILLFHTGLRQVPITTKELDHTFQQLTGQFPVAVTVALDKTMGTCSQTPVRKQIGGSCWAYTTASWLESLSAINNKPPMSISPHYLMFIRQGLHYYELYLSLQGKGVDPYFRTLSFSKNHIESAQKSWKTSSAYQSLRLTRRPKPSDFEKFFLNRYFKTLQGRKVQQNSPKSSLSRQFGAIEMIQSFGILPENGFSQNFAFTPPSDSKANTFFKSGKSSFYVRYLQETLEAFRKALRKHGFPVSHLSIKRSVSLRLASPYKRSEKIQSANIFSILEELLNEKYTVSLYSFLERLLRKTAYFKSQARFEDVVILAFAYKEKLRKSIPIFSEKFVRLNLCPKANSLESAYKHLVSSIKHSLQRGVSVPYADSTRLTGATYFNQDAFWENTTGRHALLFTGYQNMGPPHEVTDSAALATNTNRLKHLIAKNSWGSKKGIISAPGYGLVTKEQLKAWVSKAGGRSPEWIIPLSSYKATIEGTPLDGSVLRKISTFSILSPGKASEEEITDLIKQEKTKAGKRVSLIIQKTSGKLDSLLYQKIHNFYKARELKTPKIIKTGSLQVAFFDANDSLQLDDEVIEADIFDMHKDKTPFKNNYKFDAKKRVFSGNRILSQKTAYVWGVFFDFEFQGKTTYIRLGQLGHIKTKDKHSSLAIN